MKVLAILAAIALTASVAHADPVIVMSPKAPVSDQDAKAYIVALDKAVKKVCAKAAAPIIGSNFYSYLACIKDTRAEVAKNDLTGIYAARDTGRDLVLASK